MNFKKLLPVLFFVFACATLAQAQTDNQSNTDWNLLMEKDGVQFYGREEYCLNEGDAKACHYAFIKMVNTTEVEKKVIYHIGLQYEEGCSGCDDDSEFSAQVVVPAQGEIAADCSFSNSGLWRIIRNPNLVGGWTFQSMRIVNPQID